jgi:hypothetical protein
VMRVELSVDAEFETPLAAKELNGEVKVVKTWLAGSGLFGAPQLLVDGAQPGPTPSEPAPAVDEDLKVPSPVGGFVEDLIVVSPLYAPDSLHRLMMV